MPPMISLVLAQGPCMCRCALLQNRLLAHSRDLFLSGWTVKPRYSALRTYQYAADQALKQFCIPQASFRTVCSVVYHITVLISPKDHKENYILLIESCGWAIAVSSDNSESGSLPFLPRQGLRRRLQRSHIASLASSLLPLNNIPMFNKVAMHPKAQLER